MQDVSQAAIRSILSAMPEIVPWKSSPRMMVLGDVVHIMPPTGAMGVNTALRNAGDSARRIVEVGGVEEVNEDVIKAYEAGLHEFAKEAIELSWNGGMQ